MSDTLQNILANTHGSNLYTYPTDLTRGIVPKPIHSHNDYWRDVPFYSALSAGAISVEADVWLINGTLYVGHEISALTPERTFASLYIDPILDTIKRQNPTTQFVSSETKNGVYDTDSGQTLYLWIDLKTDGPTTWPAVLSALAPLKDAGYLTTTNGKTTTRGAVTAIGTGNTPRGYFLPQDPATSSSPRFTFLDAQLSTLNTSAGINVTSLITPIASAQFSAQFGKVVAEGLNSTQLDLLRSQISCAKSRGIGARYWDQPGWPLGTRNALWRSLLEEGVALLNVDDLQGASDFWESKG
ncbi:Phosphoribosylformylglycinamidine synthase [Venturia nashicola]|uniref:Phosphoribosylformylglycinamidine synthase n=1 Tax=Venturia nashicola TaxID=86259 RepID=A0A4Z1PK93_9PEZI|nr:Phosphoribosylformylglycinamidine synthase [Venturia nashicola]